MATPGGNEYSMGSSASASGTGTETSDNNSCSSSYRLHPEDDGDHDDGGDESTVHPFEDEHATDPPKEDKVRSSNVTAFVTLLKALFGVSLLSSPRVLGETGLVLGTIVYGCLLGACMGSCWCLLQAREVVEKASPRPRPTLDASASFGQEATNAITYGDLGRKLLGVKQSVMINFLIVSLHILFGAGLVGTSIHEVSLVLGWEHDDQDNYNGEEEIWLTGRAILAACFFPIIAIMLQFRNLQQLFWICLGGIVVFILGCVGTMLFSTILVDNNNDGSVIWDIPQDAFEWKLSGVPNFVASTLCAMEGINLALPIANHFYAGNIINKLPIQSNIKLQSPVPVVTAAIGVFGITTLLVAYFGYLSGLGGSSGNQNDDDDGNQEKQCAFVAHCLNSIILRKIHRVSLTIALILTLPIILYPSLELLERWAEERHRQLKTGRTGSNQSLVHGGSWNGFVRAPPSDSLRLRLQMEEHLFGTESFFPFLHRHWRYRISHAFAVCLLAIVDRPWERGLVLYKGIGLSIACFVLPVVLFVRAHTLAVVLQKPLLATALAGLVSLGLVNFVLVIFSVFTKHNFLPTEIHDDPLGHHHEERSHSADQ